VKLVSLDVMKEHLHVDHDADDDDIERKIEQASHAVIDYLHKTEADYELDDDGNVELGDDGEPSVPFSERAAVTLMTEMLYSGAILEYDLEHGYLPKPVLNLLYIRRTPAIG